MSYEIRAGDIYEAILAGAREVTLEALKDVDFSTSAGQAQAKSVLEQVLQALQGTLDVTVENAVDVGDKPGRKLGEVTLTGTSVPLRGLASERPAASASNKGYVYWSVDTGDVSVSTGTAWRSLGVA